MLVHEYASIFPALDISELEGLAADIMTNGLRNPIVTYQGKILDGRNRYSACLMAHMEPVYEDYKGSDPLGYVISLNLHRRHLSTSQRALVAANIAGLERGDNQHSSFELTSQAKAADLLNVGLATVKRANVVKNEGIPELVEAVERDEITVSEASEIAREEPEAQREILERRPFVINNSGNNEWYTPPEYIAAARELMGGIDLDPASCEIANKIVTADKFFSIEEDGLKQEWRGRIWMNPPYASNLIGQFASKLVSEVRAGNVTQACVLVNNATETRWFQEMTAESVAVCFVQGRIKFIDKNGITSGTPLQGQAILYFGENPFIFTNVFKKFGVILNG